MDEKASGAAPADLGPACKTVRHFCRFVVHSAAVNVVPLPVPVHGLPETPPAELDPFLDAAAECFARYGVQRTSVQDVAQALRVNRERCTDRWATSSQ